MTRRIPACGSPLLTVACGTAVLALGAGAFALLWAGGLAYGLWTALRPIDARPGDTTEGGA